MKDNLVNESGGLVNDCISRQAAIDALDEIEAEVADGFGFEYEKWRKYFCDLPSAQPEHPTGVQDILQYLDEYLHPIVSPEHWSVYSELYDMVSMLPSAQPQACDDAISREDAKWVVFCNRDHVEDQTNAIDSLPCVQPKRMKGKWIDCSSSDHYKCSVCGCRTGFWLEDNDTLAEWLSDFCPSCGADMRGEDDE